MNKSHNLTITLIKMFVVLAETKTTTQTGKVLHLSQSAISHNLRKLRAELDDELFIRNSNHMEMTSKAITLYPKFKAWLLALEEIVTPDEFDPMTSTETFVVACSDLFEHMYGLVMLKKIHSAAPNAKLKFIKLDANNLVEDLTKLKCDVAVAARQIDSTELKYKRLYTDSYASCVRAGHSLLKSKKSLDDYLEYPHILSSLNDGNTSAVDLALERVERKRDLKYVTFNFSNVPFFIEDSYVIWTAPKRYIEFCKKRHEIELFSPPVTLNELKINMYWANVNDKSPAGTWLRELVLNMTSE